MSHDCRPNHLQPLTISEKWMAARHALTLAATSCWSRQDSDDYLNAWDRYRRQWEKLAAKDTELARAEQDYVVGKLEFLAKKIKLGAPYDEALAPEEVFERANKYALKQCANMPSSGYGLPAPHSTSRRQYRGDANRSRRRSRSPVFERRHVMPAYTSAPVVHRNLNIPTSTPRVLPTQATSQAEGWVPGFPEMSARVPHQGRVFNYETTTTQNPQRSHPGSSANNRLHPHTDEFNPVHPAGFFSLAHSSPRAPTLGRRAALYYNL
ncbi:hypothetical protein JCM11641_001331 [Rhodosporidiobolus odoratus]